MANTRIFQEPSIPKYYELIDCFRRTSLTGKEQKCKKIKTNKIITLGVPLLI